MGTKSNNGSAHYRRTPADITATPKNVGMRPTYGYNRTKPMSHSNQFASRKRSK